MNKDRWQQIEKIFYAAMEQPPDEREAFVSQACASDEDLLREVQALLAANQDAKSFLDAPVQMPPHSGTFSPTLVMPHPTISVGAAVESGVRIGAYRLIRELGRGGMGAVWLAERDDGHFYQQVAIKLLHAGSENEEVIRRFRHERQILASLDHPNIARLLDGGTTEDGRPYFVMEYIEGLPIDEYCRQQQLSVDNRLRLFRQVCAAVHYAHQNLVIHRDLKPSNIAVTEDGTPKLLDFGIAKLIQPDLSRSYDTLTGVTPMTPAYASPEQVRGEKLTTASDVYSLGVVLYELLTGRSPYRLKASAFGELMRAIIEQEPERPSTAITREGGAPPTNPITIEPTDKLRRRLSGDIDSIVLMALRKEPPSRYGSVEQFSEDLRRYLEGLPTQARRGTFGYRALKYIRRNKVPVAAAALILLSLVSGIGATLRQARIAKAAQLQAEAEKSEAQSQRNRAEAALTTAEERRQQAEAASTDADQQRVAAETQRLAAEEERNIAQTQRKLADEQRQRAETQERSNRRLLYTSRMGLAQQAWESANVGRARELLDFYLPRAGEPDFRGFEWFYLWRLCHREVKTFTATGSFDGVAYSPNAKVLVTLSTTPNNALHMAEVTFRDASTWQILSSHKFPDADTTGLMAVSRNTSKVIIAASPNSIRLFSFSDYQEQLRIDDVNAARSLAISADGGIIAVGTDSGSLSLFDASTGRKMRTLNGHQQQINTVAFSLNGQTLASGSFDKTVRLWDVKTGKEIRVLDAEGQVPNSAVFTSDGNQIIVACSNVLRVWETTTGKPIMSRPIGPDRPVVAISPDGKTVATGGMQPMIRLWDTQTWQETTTIKGHGNAIRSLAFAPNGTQLVSGSLDQTARIWNLNPNENAVVTLSNPQTSFIKAHFTSDGQKIISAALNTVIATVWDTTSGQKLLQTSGHARPADASGQGAMLAMSPDSRLIATGGLDRLIKIWDATSGKEIRAYSGLSYLPLSLVFSPDSKTIAVGDSGQVKLWDIASGRELSALKIPGKLVEAVLFLPDNKTIVTGAAGIQFWEMLTGREVRNIRNDSSAIFSIAASANGKYLATGLLNSSIGIWEIETGKQLFMLKGHSAIVRSVSFSPDGKRLASAGDGTVKLWDLETGQEIITLKEEGVRFPYVDFSPDGKQLLAPFGRGARIWLSATEEDVRAETQ